ncbi:MAG TPA: alpha-(1-2)-phosphatidylinositol mannosyltransferase, partial [Thermoanaerobaculia bacterium]|nr:alpha-(1-2)-phosphatidylinositol mannosyltransferase [Thermoanaerobaculia bacterium]
GLRVPPGDADSLAAALREVLADAERWRTEVAVAASRVRAQFSAEAVCAQLERLYGEAVASAPRRVAAAAAVTAARPA